MDVSGERRTRLESPHGQVAPLFGRYTGRKVAIFPAVGNASSISLLKLPLFSFFFLLNSLLLGMLFQCFSSITLRLGLLFLFFRQNFTAVGNALLFLLCSTTSGRTGTCKRSSCDVHFSTGASAAISASAGAMPPITGAGVATTARASARYSTGGEGAAITAGAGAT